MPIEKPHVGRFGPYQVVQLHVTTPRATIASAMQSAIHQVATVLEAQGVAPAGPWFAHHHRRPTETFDFDVCFPVAQKIELTGELQHAVVPETVAARTAYHGPYDGLPAAWPEFVAWIRAHGHKPREDFFEVYSVGPREAEEAEAWQTDLIYPLLEGTEDKERIV